MLSRPWPIKILFLCHLLAPAINLLFSAWMSGISMFSYLEIKMQRASIYEFLVMFALLPLAGVVIFLCKKWSYFAYLLIMAMVFHFNFVKWQEYPHLFDLSYVITFFTVNIFVVGYFTVPAVRQVYFNERLRWWESKPRYLVGLSGLILKPSGNIPCEIDNISQGGARIRILEDHKIGDELTLKFSYEEEDFLVNAFKKHEQNGYVGVEFSHSESTSVQIKNVIQKSFSKKFMNRNTPKPTLESFFDWLNTLLTTGRGLVPNPQMPELAKKKKLKKTVSKKQKKTKSKKIKS